MKSFGGFFFLLKVEHTVKPKTQKLKVSFWKMQIKGFVLEKFKFETQVISKNIEIAPRFDELLQ